MTASALMSGWAPGNTLTARQYQVLRAAAFGFTGTDTATLLHLSIHTVKVYKRQIYERLGARTTAQAVAIAVTRGLISIEAIA